MKLSSPNRAVHEIISSAYDQCGCGVVLVGNARKGGQSKGGTGKRGQSPSLLGIGAFRVHKKGAK